MNKRPNVLVIMTDQHIAKIAGFAGDAIVDTRHLDELAGTSARFSNAVTPSPLCTPARMCMLTGKEPYNCSAWGNHWVLFPEHRTWPGYFAEHGYRTCLVGKMHFGGADQMSGFQDRPYGDLHHGLGHQPEPLTLFPAYEAARSAGATEIPESLLSDVVTTREALAYLLELNSREPQTPWLTCVSYTRPHPPFTAPARYLRKYQNKIDPPPQAAAESLEPYARANYDRYGCASISEDETRRGVEGYYACVDFVDDCMGELLDGLKRAGMLENTVIMYTTDHGEMLGNHGLWGKAVYYDQAVNIPVLVRAPDLNGGGSIDSPVSLIDLFPTACELAGLPVPDGLDGTSMVPAMERGEEIRPFARSMFAKYATRVARKDGGAHPAHADSHAEAYANAAMMVCRTNNMKYVDIEGGSPLLFDLGTDPGESTNLAGDPRYSAAARALHDDLFADISWNEIHSRIARDRERITAHLSHVKPSTPNQYMLPDGRVFDAESALYAARWLLIDEERSSGGIIPQQFG